MQFLHSGFSGVDCATLLDAQNGGQESAPALLESQKDTVMHDAALRTLKPHIQTGMEIVASRNLARQQIFAAGREGLAGLIYALIASGTSSRMSLVSQVTELLGRDACDDVVGTLCDLAGTFAHGPWYTNDEGDDYDPQYKINLDLSAD